jgi:protein AIR1/2
VFDRPPGPSAFSTYNVMSGPFYNPNEKRLPAKPRQLGVWESADNLPERWGHGLPIKVGEQAKKKAKEKLERQARALDESEDDWFADRVSRQPIDRSSGTNKPTIGLSLKNDSRSHLSLLERIEFGGADDRSPDPRHHRFESHRGDDRARSRQYEGREHEPSNRRNGKARSDRWKVRAREDRDRAHYASGPRYNGGYRR